MVRSLTDPSNVLPDPSKCAAVAGFWRAERLMATRSRQPRMLQRPLSRSPGAAGSGVRARVLKKSKMNPESKFGGPLKKPGRSCRNRPQPRVSVSGSISAEEMEPVYRATKVGRKSVDFVSPGAEELRLAVREKARLYGFFRSQQTAKELS